MDESGFLNSDYTTKLQSSKQYSTETKAEIQINGTVQKAQKQTHAHIANYSETKEARIYNEKKAFFNKLCWENRTVTDKIMKLEHSLTSYTEINSNRLKA